MELVHAVLVDFMEPLVLPTFKFWTHLIQLDVHLKLEDVMAKFLRREKAILYASAYATVTSTICVFAHRGDFLIWFDWLPSIFLKVCTHFMQ